MLSSVLRSAASAVLWLALLVPAAVVHARTVPVVALTAPAGESFSLLRLSPIAVSPGGTLFVRCTMARGTRILGVELLNP
jgi:hypothetical protein